MFTLIAENKYGQQLELTNNDAYVITEIDGLDPPDATINTSKNANADGSVFNSSYINDRQIIITMAINYPAEENRINLYKYFKTKMPITLYYENDTRDVYIDGYVQNMQIGFFDKKQIAQITIQCPKPLFNDVNDDTSHLSEVADLFEFPFSIEQDIEFSTIGDANITIISDGDVESGMIMTFHALDEVSDPVIYNTDTNEYFGLNVNMSPGDEVTVCTKSKEKSVIYTAADGTTSNAIGNVQEGSTWLQLIPGVNNFTLTDTGNPGDLYVQFTYTSQYEGV